MILSLHEDDDEDDLRAEALEDEIEVNLEAVVLIKRTMFWCS